MTAAARVAGRMAYENGRPRSSSPYARSGVDHQAFVQGWLAARADTPAVERLATGLARADGLRARKKAATRARLIDAARFLFSNVGYFDVGIRDVASRMGMSIGAVFAHVEGKAALWRLAMGGPPPSEALAEELALIFAQRPGWDFVLRSAGGGFLALLTAPDYRPFTDAAVDCHTGKGDSPAEALRQARIAAERGDADRRRRAVGLVQEAAA